MGGELVLQITQGAEDGCVSRVLCYRYSNRFFSAPWADEYRGELLLHNPDYPTSSPPQSTLLYTVRRSRLDIYLWFGCCCPTFVIPLRTWDSGAINAYPCSQRDMGSEWSYVQITLTRLVRNHLHILCCPALELAEILIHVYSYRPVNSTQHYTIAVIAAYRPKSRQA